MRGWGCPHGRPDTKSLRQLRLGESRVSLTGPILIRDDSNQLLRNRDKANFLGVQDVDDFGKVGEVSLAKILADRRINSLPQRLQL